MAARLGWGQSGRLTDELRQGEVCAIDYDAIQETQPVMEHPCRRGPAIAESINEQLTVLLRYDTS